MILYWITYQKCNLSQDLHCNANISCFSQMAGQSTNKFTWFNTASNLENATWAGQKYKAGSHTFCFIFPWIVVKYPVVVCMKIFQTWRFWVILSVRLKRVSFYLIQAKTFSANFYTYSRSPRNITITVRQYLYAF